MTEGKTRRIAQTQIRTETRAGDSPGWSGEPASTGEGCRRAYAFALRHPP